MNPARSRRRWWLFALLIFAGQVALIFWLSDFSAPAVRRAPTAPTLRLVSGPVNELFALNDPTLFALPHERSFSGRARRLMNPAPYRPFEWNAELEWLPLPAAQLGHGLAKFLETNRVEVLTTLAAPEPALIQPELSSAPVFARKSSVRIEGQLKNRKLLTPLEPSSWPHSDLLTNTVVDLVVREDGWPLSVTLLRPGSGSKEADEQARRLASTARFESFVRSGPGSDAQSQAGLMWGTMIFTWHTLPATNSATK
jgi:hypothetical protein